MFHNNHKKSIGRESHKVCLNFHKHMQAALGLFCIIYTKFILRSYWLNVLQNKVQIYEMKTGVHLILNNLQYY